MNPLHALPRRQIVICGNGASAAALIHALARAVKCPTTVCVIGEGNRTGEGIAYATRNPEHLLNVPARRMSIDPDTPDHFLQWLARKGLEPRGWDDQFLPRQLYGDYLHDAIAAAICASSQMELEMEWSHVTGLARRDKGWTVSYRNGAVDADMVVLATGNDMPSPIGTRYSPDIAARIVDNPWTPLSIDRMENVLILGSALTAVDVVLTLLGQGHQGQITLLSRRGLLPYTHVPCLPGEPITPPWPRTTRALLRDIRQAVGRTPPPAQWQAFMDSMRPHWPDIWGRLPTAERRRFLRHGAAIWNVHRHRLAPGVGARIESLLGQRFRKVRGRIAGIARNGDGSLVVEVRGRDGLHLIEADRLINCSGPNSDPGKSRDGLIESIVAGRHARASESGIGLDIDGENRVIDRDGQVQQSLYAMGALTRGRWWEITAMPEIAAQAKQIATTILHRLPTKDAAQPPPVSQPLSPAV
jgi:uncharacterized NAD(P)/FAD-binding protein YdhS